MSYSTEFKHEVIQKCIDGFSKHEISRLYGVSGACIENWKKQLVTTGNLESKMQGRPSMYPVDMLKEFLSKTQVQYAPTLPGNIATASATTENFNERKAAEFIELRFRMFAKHLLNDEILWKPLKAELAKTNKVPQEPMVWPNHPALWSVLKSRFIKEPLSTKSPLVQDDLFKKQLLAKKYISLANCGSYIDFDGKEQQLFDQSFKLKTTQVMLRGVGSNVSESQCLFMRENNRRRANVLLSNHTGSIQGFLVIKDLEGNETIVELEEFCMLSETGEADSGEPEKGIFTYLNKRYGTLFVETITGTPRLHDVISIADAVIANRGWTHINLWEETADPLPESVFREIYDGMITTNP
jgi:transposase